MDILKDLPSRDKDNFSRYSQGSFKNCEVAKYIRIKSGDEKAQVIVTDAHSLLIRELEKEASRRRRISLKRGPSHAHVEQQDGDRKVPRTESEDYSLF